MKSSLISLAVNKAMQSTCNYKVSAVGLNSKGDVLGCSINKRNVCRKGMSHHAEIELIKRFGRKIRTIIICRVNPSGVILPIHSCSTCRKILDRMDIDILTVTPMEG